MIRSYRLPIEGYISNQLEAERWEPGREVRWKGDERAWGIIVGVANDRVTVVWSVTPGWDIENFKFPSIRKVVPSASIVQAITEVQLMTLPLGLIFHLDHTYGSGGNGNRDK
jgi:hypothetical protein